MKKNKVIIILIISISEKKDINGNNFRRTLYNFPTAERSHSHGTLVTV